MSGNNSVISWGKIETQANLYKHAKTVIEEQSDKIQEKVENETKVEREIVENAIKQLNEKIKKISESDEIKQREKLINENSEIIKNSVKIAFDTYKQISEIIDNRNITKEEKIKYKQTLYRKLIDKFMTEKEKQIFENLMNNKIPLIIMGGDKGSSLSANNLIL